MPHAQDHEVRERDLAGMGLVLLGLPKTGTTWLASALAQAGSLELFDESDKVEQLWARRDRPAVLIAESATDPLFLAGIDNRVPALRALAQRLPARHYVLILREPVDWVCSLYRQYLRRGGTVDFRAFVGGDDQVVQPQYVDYGRLVDEIAAYLPGPLAVCGYDRLKADPRGFVDDLARALGDDVLPPDLAAAIPDAALRSRANVGVRGLGARIVRGVNRHRRTRWNPHGWFSWKRFERLPWHRLAGVGHDVIDGADLEWLESELADHVDWPRWQAAFADGGVVRCAPGVSTQPG